MGYDLDSTRRRAGGVSPLFLEPRTSGIRPLFLRCNRRAWLTVAGLSFWAGLPTWPLAAASRPSGPGFGRAKSVIVLYASGGQSQLDTWDPKPAAPDHVRGEFAAASTAVPGLAFCEHLPRVARLADRLTVIRSLSHEDLDHGSATYLTLTGHYHPRRSSNPPPSPTDFPTLGALVRKVRPDERFVYDAIHLNGPALVPTTPAPGQDGGLLGREYEPLVLGDVREGSPGLPGLEAQSDVPVERMAARRGLKQSLDAAVPRLTELLPARDLSRLYDRACDFLSSPHCRQAFQLEREPRAVRERYGLYRTGQACLLARRLVEAGVPWITVMCNHTNRGQDQAPDDPEVYGWDTHNDIFEALRVHLLPRFDLTFSALLEDLDQRGLLDQTLVVCLGEFGRAPRVALEPRFAGSTPGRKHWASVYSIVMAGAGVARGGVIGASDRFGGEPITERIGPWDVAASLFWSLGIDPHSHYEDATGRPFALATGRPIRELYQ
ncbi:MAG: DUF1501 domain-containing protein [Pirellulaceae bacterium]|nr:DUF1501 domain-containing protein [Pirellulaceae bacterium]